MTYRPCLASKMPLSMAYLKDTCSPLLGSTTPCGEVWCGVVKFGMVWCGNGRNKKRRRGKHASDHLDEEPLELLMPRGPQLLRHHLPMQPISFSLYTCVPMHCHSLHTCVCRCINKVFAGKVLLAILIKKNSNMLLMSSPSVSSSCTLTCTPRRCAS